MAKGPMFRLAYFILILIAGVVIAGVVIGLEETLVTVSEDVGMRELCASVMSGMVMRDVLVDVAYQDRSALGRYS